MNDADVHEHIGEEAPPLSAEGERAEIGADADEVPLGWGDPGDAGGYHDEIDGYVCADEHARDYGLGAECYEACVGLEAGDFLAIGAERLELLLGREDVFFAASTASVLGHIRK